MKRGRRSASKAVVGVEPLEGRALLSYLVVQRDHQVRAIHTGDARNDEPLFSNGLAIKHEPHFYPAYTGPRRPELNGVQATAVVTGANFDNLVLSGTVAGPIPAKPTTAGQESIYTFGIDRGGASEVGPFRGRPHIRFDAVVVAQVTSKGISGYVLVTDPITHLFPTSTASRSPLTASVITIKGNVVTITVPLKMLSSSGHAINQWNVNFFPSIPAAQNSPQYVSRNIASFTPEYTEFQVYVKPPDNP